MSVMNRRPEQKLFEEVAQTKGIEVSFVEKDWFVTQIIGIISRINLEGFELIFTGGTALSKAHGLLQRFSEDIDFRIIAQEKLCTSDKLSAFKKAVIEAIRKEGFTIEESAIIARNGNRFFSIGLEYPTYFTRMGALRPHIQIEMTVKDMQLAKMALPVSSFLNELMKKEPEVSRIGCINPVESAVDKLSAITWRIPDRVRGDKYDDPSLVRHLHDLAILKKQALASPDFPAMVATVMQNDDSRSKNNSSFAGLPIVDKFQQMLRILDEDKKYPEEYNRFVKGVSYASEGEIPSFEKAVQAVRELVKVVLLS